ncbi:MAG: hypothetical protein GXY83_07220 [Rhodopirellula sp.]|nr:hypothetical protein [Rhodopirellula sp.]
MTSARPRQTSPWGCTASTPRFASFFNRRHRRCDALFQGRFKAVLVEDESHAIQLTRYVHLNPVRAKIVARPEEYHWSSYQDYLGVRKAPAWLNGETVLAELALLKSRRHGNDGGAAAIYLARHSLLLTDQQEER